MKKGWLIICLVVIGFGASACGNKEETQPADYDYASASKEADIEFSQVIEEQDKADQQATKDYLNMLKEAEVLAQDGKFTEAKEKIRYAETPGSDEKGQSAKEKGTDYESQLQQLEWLQKYEEEGVSGLDSSVREDSRKAMNLENGSAILAKLVQDLTEKLDNGRSMEKIASSDVDGYKPDTLSDVVFIEGVDSSGIAQASNGEVKLKGIYSGGARHLAINDNGTIMGNVEVASDGSFEIFINNIDNLPWGFDLIPSDSLQKGQTDVVSYDQAGGKYCRIKVE